jgi:hypothetical protein
MAPGAGTVRLWLAGYPGGRRAGLAVVLVALAAVAYTTVTAPFGADYARPDCGCDDPGPSIRALAHGHPHEAAHLQPLLGPFSIIVRAPFAAVAYATGGDDYDAYKLGLIPCLLALAALGAFVVRKLPDTRVNRVAAPVLAVLFVINPGTARAVHFGHPEELLAAALAVAGVIAAANRRPVLAGVLVGAAFATKQWALLAVFVALAVHPAQYLRLAAAAAAASLVVFLPAFVGDPSRFVDLWTHGGQQLDTAGQGGSSSVRPTNVWWPFTTYTGSQANGTARYALPAWLDALAHPAILVAGAALSAGYALVRRDRVTEIALLLALVLLLRCLLDPFTNSYYNAAFLIALAAYEVYSRARPPWLAVVASAALALNVALADQVNADGLNRIYLAWTLPLLAVMSYKAFMPAREGLAAPETRAGSAPI